MMAVAPPPGPSERSVSAAALALDRLPRHRQAQPGAAAGGDADAHGLRQQLGRHALALVDDHDPAALLVGARHQPHAPAGRLAWSALSMSESSAMASAGASTDQRCSRAPSLPAP